MRVWCECSSGLGTAYHVLMVAVSYSESFRRKTICIISIALFVTSSISATGITRYPMHLEERTNAKEVAQDEEGGIWIDGGQPWPQFGRTASRIGDVPGHSPEGGAGFGAPINASSLKSIVKPAVNWIYGSYSIGTDALSTPIADLRQSIEVGPGASERCGGSSLFTVIVQTEDVSGSPHSILRLIEGEDSELAWQADLGETEDIKASPVIVDIDEDGRPEIVVVFDSGGSMNIEAWSPRLSCTVTGWSYSGNSGERLWSWSDDGLMISSDEGPYVSGFLGGHKPTTQPLLADLDLDGTAELVIAAIDEISEEPVVIALPLQTNGTPSSMWEVSLNKGSHPSDPSFAQVDDDTGYVILTTIEANNGGLWVWKIDSSTGNSIWQNGLNMNNLDGDTNSPHVRLPGPVIANLDSDSDPEIIITIPSDADGSSAVDGAEFRGLEISDGSQLWSFEASNGFADAPPVAIDTNEDGEHDRVCWNTWWQTTTERQGAAGCHDVSDSDPNQEWVQDLEQSSGTPNDEIAVSPPTWMDIDSEDEPELLVSYGRTLWAFDGESGSPAGVNSAWSDGIDLDHRTWSSPSLADIDGDATIDLVLGSMAISMGMSDVRALTDGRGIEFNPSSPDPGQEVTITAYVENAGTVETEESVDVSILANGVKIGGDSIPPLEPVEPSGVGSFASFNVAWNGGLGEHLFEIVVDPNQNLSQTRFDNDIQSKILTIVPPYNASFEIPTEPVRVDPGGSKKAIFGIKSTGRLAGEWSLSVNGDNLPEGWSWVDQTPGGINGIEIGVGDVWSPSLIISAPENALGSDSGFLSLTLTHDNGNETFSANLPIEANRTRGLSLRGPDGTSQSTGLGLVSEEAIAWLLIENLGNAAEQQIAISWDGTSWGSDLRIFDSDGIEISALSLGPGEIVEVTVRLPVPAGAAPGDSVETPLSMCVGAGEEEACSSVELEFIASRTVIMPSHIRTVPENGLQWEVFADLGEGEEIVNWSLSEAGMVMQGWSWSGYGGLNVSGDVVSLAGTPGSRASGILNLDMPEDARPSFHLFEDTGENGSNSPLSLSVEVLQIHRAGLEVNSPTLLPYVVDVDEPSVVVLRLENPGNGDDSYHLSYEVMTNENITVDPGVIVSFSSNPVELGAGSLRTLPLSVTLPDSTPARVPLSIKFVMTSHGNGSVSDEKEVVFEVMQDHRWDIEAAYSGIELGGSTIPISPGGIIEIPINATNIGNLNDDLAVEVVYEIIRSGEDVSQGWLSNGSEIFEVGVNQTVSLMITNSVPSDSWNGSIMETNVSLVARNEVILQFSFRLEVMRAPGWSISSENADLEIEPEGSQVSLEVIQIGNNPSQPFVSVYVSGQKDWVIEEFEELPIVSPGDSTTLLLNITPPKSATQGVPVELRVRVRDGDALGLVEVSLPLRVSAIYNFSMNGSGPWVISQDGGFPMAMVENHGNSPTTISFQVLSLPQNWSIRGSEKIVLGIGEARGIPLELVPDQNWSGQEKTIRILSEDPSGNQRELIISTKKSQFSWASSPYIFALEGDDAIINIHGTDPESELVDSGSLEKLDWTNMGWIVSSRSIGNGSILVEGIEELDFSMFVSDYLTRSAICSISGEIGNIGGTCLIGNGSEEITYQILLIADNGLVLDSDYGTLSENEVLEFVNLSGNSWDPDPGERSIAIRALDERGFVIGSTQKSFDVRRTDWNVGLGEIEIVDGEIRVPTKRFNENLLESADCIITLSAGSHYSEHLIDMTQAFVPSPIYERPDVDDGEELVVNIGCSFPWDIDSNPNDNEARLVLSGGIILQENIDEWGTGALSAVLVIGLYLGVMWIVRNNRERREMLEAAETALAKKKAKKEIPVEEGKFSEEESEGDSQDRRVVSGDYEQEEVEITEEESFEEGDEFDERLRRLLDR